MADATSSDKAQGPEGITQIGHRDYVGGKWDEIGDLQFSFLKQQGLRPEQVLLDIACGSLRLGVKVIPYLQPGHYLGMDKEQQLLDAGIHQELGETLLASQRPRLLCSADFAFEQFATPVDAAIAQSLFTHLPPPLIGCCLEKLRPWLKPDGRFFATFFEVEQQRDNPSDPHDHGYFAYTREQMQTFGSDQGYRMDYIGGWGHPRDQVMVVYRHPDG
ncbi:MULTISPECIES: class I SAM-dependent methyltransferase [unclassified Synechococcus]|uniref:class I SAM-dependent methyltransferase n=1 Tax=unclassified Synechococcus TaxID=2626047 RepID=UPI00082F515F|nr:MULTISPECIES: class I SAM-dependent methyltransferase [unclassified Synechococcus]